jgi:hypothetical protein
MNLVNIIKNIRNMKIILESSLMKSPVRRMELQHVEDNIIDVDSDKGIEKVPKNLKIANKGSYADQDLDNSLQERILFKDNFF